MKRITLQINNENFRFAKSQADAYGYKDAGDFLNALLNAALVDRMDEYEKRGLFRLPTGPSQAKRDSLDEIEEDEGGGLRLKSGRGGAGELDDGIPF